MTTHTEEANKRWSDKLGLDRAHDKIADLIEESNDPEKRALLIVLQSINLALVANTKTVNDIDEQLKAHLVLFNNHSKREEAMLNKGRGAWWVMSWTLGLIQVGMIWLMMGINHELKDLRDADSINATRITIVEQHVKGSN